MKLNQKVLTRAHEREFGSITETNRPIWMLADAAEAGSHDGASHEGIPTDNPAFCEWFWFFQKINRYFFKPHCAIYRHCTANRAGPRRLIFWKRRQRAQEVTGRRRRKVWWFFTRIKTENSSLFSLFYKDEPRPVTNARAVPLKDQSDEAQSSFAKMSKRFSRSLKNLMQMDGKCHTFVI